MWWLRRRSSSRGGWPAPSSPTVPTTDEEERYDDEEERYDMRRLANDYDERGADAYSRGQQQRDCCGTPSRSSHSTTSGRGASAPAIILTATIRYQPPVELTLVEQQHRRREPENESRIGNDNNDDLEEDRIPAAPPPAITETQPLVNNLFSRQHQHKIPPRH